MQKCQGTQIKAVLWSHPPFNSKHKDAFIWVPWHFWHMLDKQKNKSFLYGKNTHFIFYGPYPFCAYSKIYMQSSKIREKRVKIQDTFVLSRICQKCQGTQIKAFLSFGINEKYTKRGGSFYSPFNSKRKTLLFEYPDIFGICLIKQKCLVFSKSRLFCTS